MRRTSPGPHGNETRSEFAARLYDTADPPISLYRAARLAGIKGGSLRTYLLRREYYLLTRCPTCGQLPSKPRDKIGRELQRKQGHPPPS